MNRNDFYKELMTEYALDPEKIRMNALKQAKKPAWQKAVSTYWKPAVGAAAAVAVTVAGVAYTTQSSAPDIRIAPEEALSASQRLIEAEQDYFNQNREEKAFCNMYVTFLEAVSYNDIIFALSGVNDSGEIELCSLYLQNGNVFKGDKVSEYGLECANEKTIVAAKINLPSVYYRDIQDLYIVYLTELGSAEINDDTFTPIVVEDRDPLENDHLSITTTAVEQPPVTTTSFYFETTATTTTVSSAEEDKPVLGESSNESTTIPPVVSDDSDEEEIADGPTAEEVTTTTTAPVITTSTETTTTYYRGDVGLLTELYELNVKNSLETRIFGSNAVVLTKNSAYLFTLGGFGSSGSGQEIELSNPKFAYSDENSVILTGCGSDGLRDMLCVIDLNSGYVFTYDAGANIGGNEIGSIQHSSEPEKYFIKVLSSDSTLVYEAYVNTTVTFRPLFEINAPVSLAGYDNGNLYFAANENETTKLCKFNCTDGTTVELATFSGLTKIRRGVDFNSFAISDGASSFIVDVNNDMLIPAAFGDDVAVITDNGEIFFRTSSAVYKVTSTFAVVEADRAVQFEKPVLEEFIVNEINSEKVVVVRNDETIAIW